MQETPLLGGNVTAGVVRVGDTVRRPSGYWTPAVHALLRHLEVANFMGSPRVLGIDERGREMLTYVEGDVAWPWEAFARLASDASLIAVAGLIDGYHSAVSTFISPPGAVWSDVPPCNGAEIICHNDLAPWNLIAGPSGELTFIDWDLAAPGTRVSDLACAARYFAPLVPNCPLDLPIVHRLRVLCDVWDVRPDTLIEATVRRAQADFAGLKARAEAGIQPWRKMWDDGHGAANGEITAFVEENASRWLAELNEASGHSAG